jgi:hypothetical protein
MSIVHCEVWKWCVSAPSVAYAFCIVHPAWNFSSPASVQCTTVPMTEMCSQLSGICLLSWALKMETTCSSETPDGFQQTTWYCILEDRTLGNHWCESHKSYKMQFWFVTVIPRLFNFATVLYALALYCDFILHSGNKTVILLARV